MTVSLLAGSLRRSTGVLLLVALAPSLHSGVGGAACPHHVGHGSGDTHGVVGASDASHGVHVPETEHAGHGGRDGSGHGPVHHLPASHGDGGAPCDCAGSCPVASPPAPPARSAESLGDRVASLTRRQRPPRTTPRARLLTFVLPWATAPPATL